MEANMKLANTKAEALDLELKQVLQEKSHKQVEIDNLTEKNHSLNEDVEHLTLEISNLQKEKELLLNQNKRKILLLEKENESLSLELNEERIVHENYKKKAKKVFEEKDELISRVSDPDFKNLDPEEESNVPAHYIKSIIDENEMLKLEIVQLNNIRSLYEAKKIELIKLEEENHKNILIQKQDYDRLANETRLEKKALNDNIDSLLHSIFEKDQEIEQLETSKLQLQKDIKRAKKLLQAKSISKGNENLEERLKIMTERLLNKQTKIDSLSSEMATLKLNIEHLESRLRNKNNVDIERGKIRDRRGDHSSINIRRNRLTSYIEPMPIDDSRGLVKKNVVKAATILDVLTSGMGVFLVKYPIAMLFIIVYMIMLHLYVLYILGAWSSALVDMENLKEQLIQFGTNAI
eukprot:TRINITY_DN3019_c0_g1_i4.p1 TRINITY_DN3019_c0_g1~~TRINITY_DN3019_c0_g1_i4.p1  ORF type:complete len:407 (-),score=83.02 TRINITY_DN3019_c0_g1_i4:86-1306(-)